MKECSMKPNRRFFTICLGILAFILIAYGLLRLKFGPFLPAKIDQNVPNAVMVGAIAILLWNRKLRGEAEKAEAERKRLEVEAAARLAEGESAAEESAAGHEDPPEGEGGADAPR